MNHCNEENIKCSLKMICIKRGLVLFICLTLLMIHINPYAKFYPTNNLSKYSFECIQSCRF
jgi:hypothetical protein